MQSIPLVSHPASRRGNLPANPWNNRRARPPSNHLLSRAKITQSLRVLSGLAPLPLADNGSVGYRAASHRGADADAVLGMWIGSRNRATRAHRPGLSPVPLPG